MPHYLAIKGLQCSVCGRKRGMQLETVLGHYMVCTECVQWMFVRRYSDSEIRSFIEKAKELYPV